MRAIDWSELISETRSYMQFRDEISSLTMQKESLESDLPCMKSIFSLCTDRNYQRIFSSYMYHPADITQKKYIQLAEDIEKANAELKKCKKDLKRAISQESNKRYRIHHILVDVMDEFSEDHCLPYYCPEELLVSENLSVLKTIVQLAREDAPTMYGEGGFAYGYSVIGNLSHRVNKLEAELQA